MISVLTLVNDTEAGKVSFPETFPRFETLIQATNFK